MVKKPSVMPATYQSDHYMGEHIKRLIGERYLNEIKQTDVQTFINSVANKNGKLMSEKLVKKVKILFNELIEYSIDNNYLLTSPVRRIRMPMCIKTDKDSKFLNINQIARLLDLVSGNLKYYTIIYVLVNTGLRINELLALKWSDIIEKGSKYALRVDKALNIDDNRHYILGETKTKSSNRYVAVNKNVVESLYEWRNEFTDKYIEQCKKNGNSDFIFCNKYGNIIQYDNFRYHFQEYLKRNGKREDEHYTFHQLRHSYASLLRHKGHDKEEISDLMGHSDSDITEKIYITEFEPTIKYESVDIMADIMKDIEDVRTSK